MGRGLKLVLPARNLALKFNTVPYYKYIYSICIGVLYHICEILQRNTYNKKHCDESNKRLSGHLNAEHKKTTSRTMMSPTTYIARFRITIALLKKFGRKGFITAIKDSKI